MLKPQRARRWVMFLVILIGTLAAAGAAKAATAVDPGGSPALEEIIGKGVLRVGVNPLFKPFSFQGEKDRRQGVDIDIATLLARELGVRLELVVPRSFSDLIPMLTQGRIDLIMAGMSITFDRAKVVDFTDPYFDTGLSILLNKVASARLGIATADNYEALVGELRRTGRMGELRIAVTRGKAPEQVVPRYFPGAVIRPYASNEEAAAATLRGEADIMVHDEIFLKVWLRENARDARYRLVVLDPPFKPDYYGMAVRKGNQELLNLLNTFILELRANSQIEQFMGHYLPIRARVVTRSYNISEDYYGGD